MIPIDLETFQMLLPSFHEKGKERKRLIPRTGLSSSLRLGKALKGWELIQRPWEKLVMEDSVNAD